MPTNGNVINQLAPSGRNKCPHFPAAGFFWPGGPVLMGRNGAVWVTLGTKPVKSPQWYSSLGPDVTLGSFPQYRKQPKSVQNAFLDEICCFCDFLAFRFPNGTGHTFSTMLYFHDLERTIWFVASFIDRESVTNGKIRSKMRTLLQKQ